MKLYFLLLQWLLFSFLPSAFAIEPLRILSWEGYVTEQDLKEVNARLGQHGYSYRAEVIQPLAEGVDQMFDLIRADRCDITFLTLFFIKMEKQKTSLLLQPINTYSHRLYNYKLLNPTLTHLEMGLDQGQPLYIPWGSCH